MISLRLPKRDACRLYRDLAWTWPIISPKEDYVKEAETFFRAIRKYARIKPRTLLHLGCGGGHLDFTLKNRFEVTGVDQSPAMLRLARRLNPEVSYHLGDMRSIRLGQAFDAVMAADSISYMLTEGALRAALETAYAHLKPGRVFCTYAEETKERFVQNKVSTSHHSQGDVAITLFESLYDPNPRDSTYESTFVYLIRKKGKLRIESDHHLLGLFAIGTWRRLLRQAGFRVKEQKMEGCPMFVGLKR